MDPQTVDLARWQFALTSGGHFVFVALTLGLAPLLAAMQTRATLRGGKPVHLRMVRFWGQLYAINYAVGILTGIVMEFQFGLAWSGLGHHAGEVFGASLALETVLAFFIESTFLGLWVFGWGRFNKWVHLSVLWVVTLTAYLSAYWILVTNGFLNRPVGHAEGPDGLVLDDPVALFTNPSAITAFGHIVGGALVTAGVFVAGVSAYHFFWHRGPEPHPERELFRGSLRLGVFTALPALFVTVVFGGIQLASLAGGQPMKDAVWKGEEQTVAALQIEQAERFGPGDYVPAESLTQGSALLMMAVFGLLIYLLLGGALLAFFRRAVEGFRLWHLLLMASVPLPYIAMLAGWVFREAGRQPWVIYEVLKTEDAVSELSPTQMRLSLTVFVSLLAVLAAVNWWLLLRAAKRGPQAVTLGAPGLGGPDDSGWPEGQSGEGRPPGARRATGTPNAPVVTY